MSESMEVKAALDYLPGDLVQLAGGDHPGALGKIVGTKLSKKQGFLVYLVQLQLHDTDEVVFVIVHPRDIRFLSHAE